MKRQYSYVVYYVRDFGRRNTEFEAVQVSKATYYREKATRRYSETQQHGASFIIHELKPLKHG